MKLVKKKKIRWVPFFFKCIPVLVVFYFIFLIFNQQVQINDKRQKLEYLSKKLQSQEMENEELRKNLEHNEEKKYEYIEKAARENLNFSKKGEKVFVNAAGN
ncbi:MAG: septum formation initiator family protein [Clostridia bacterium]|nr:septum formation initiator family protein [Clostridia bacterium]